MAHLFFTELVNKSQYFTTGNWQAGYGLVNTGPFTISSPTTIEPVRSTRQFLPTRGISKPAYVPRSAPLTSSPPKRTGIPAALKRFLLESLRWVPAADGITAPFTSLALNHDN